MYSYVVRCEWVIGRYHHTALPVGVHYRSPSRIVRIDYRGSGTGRDYRTRVGGHGAREAGMISDFPYETNSAYNNERMHLSKTGHNPVVMTKSRLIHVVAGGVTVC